MVKNEQDNLENSVENDLIEMPVEVKLEPLDDKSIDIFTQIVLHTLK